MAESQRRIKRKAQRKMLKDVLNKGDIEWVDETLPRGEVFHRLKKRQNKKDKPLP